MSDEIQLPSFTFYIYLLHRSLSNSFQQIATNGTDGFAVCLVLATLNNGEFLTDAMGPLALAVGIQGKQINAL